MTPGNKNKRFLSYILVEKLHAAFRISNKPHMKVGFCPGSLSRESWIKSCIPFPHVALETVSLCSIFPYLVQER